MMSSKAKLMQTVTGICLTEPTTTTFIANEEQRSKNYMDGHQRLLDRTDNSNNHGR